MTDVRQVQWTAGALGLTVEIPSEGPPLVASLALDGVVAAGGGTPLVEIGVRGAGSTWSSRRYRDGEWTARSRYVSHHADESLEIVTQDPQTGLRATTRLTSSTGVSLTTTTTLTNTGAEAVIVDWVTSAVWGAVGGTDPDGVDVWWADNEWLSEHRWRRVPFREVLPDLSGDVHGRHTKSVFARAAQGTWSSDGTLPMAAVIGGDGVGVGWQIEHNGAWLWQVGETATGVFVGALGPTDREHQWSTRLEPGESFETVPVTTVVTTTGWHGVTDALTDHRRATRRTHPDRSALPVVFNDYMNTLMGDPTTERLEPLIDAAAQVGAEIFCIDAGWYSDEDGWWDAVGEWQPSTRRFPGGLSRVLDRIRSHGMTPGLWLEPEVIGVRSRVADTLPAGAFFHRDGVRIVDNGRFQLDLRHPAARRHLDEAVDRLVSELGVGYLKFDHNVNPGAGTDREALSPGAGLLGHNRAHLDWLDGLLDRHPDLVLENCGSGGMRTDHALLSRFQLQSTSDQQDPSRYPVIAGAANAAITPEQAANWSYPQPGFTDDQIVATLCCGMLGRLYLSGHLDLMTAEQRDLVRRGVEVYRELRSQIASSRPFWPVGLPEWDDEWVVHGLRHGARSHVVLWRRDSGQPTIDLPIPGVADAAVLFGRATVEVGVDGLAVTLERPGQAVLLRLDAAG